MYIQMDRACMYVSLFISLTGHKQMRLAGLFNTVLSIKENVTSLIVAFLAAIEHY